MIKKFRKPSKEQVKKYMDRAAYTCFGLATGMVIGAAVNKVTSGNIIITVTGGNAEIEEQDDNVNALIIDLDDIYSMASQADNVPTADEEDVVSMIVDEMIDAFKEKGAELTDDEYTTFVYQRFDLG